MKQITTFILLTLVFISQAKQSQQHDRGSNASFATVGFDGCDFTSIQVAINSGAEEIRMVQGTFTEAIVLNRTTFLIGGYANCLDANSDSNQSGITTLDAANTAVAIYIQATTGNAFFILSKLEIKNGKAGDSDLGAGILLIGNTSTYLQLSDSSVHNNDGSGIALFNTGSVHIIDTNIINNSDFNGGGIYSFNSETIVYGNSTIINNSANNHGGGVYLTNNSRFNMFSNTASDNIQGIEFNSATIKGGGIYAEQGSFVYMVSHDVQIDDTITGNNASSLSISYNSVGTLGVDGNGGGIYLTGSDTEMLIFGAQIYNNNATKNGGGVAVSDNATFSFSRLPQYPCFSNQHCNRILQNQAGSDNSSGGAIYAESGATLNLGNVSFEENSADFGSAIYLIDANTTALIESSVFAKNSQRPQRDGNYVIRAFTGSSATVAFSTFANNDVQIASFGLFNASLNLTGDIIYNTTGGAIISSSGSTISNYCILAHDISGLSGTNINQAMTSPFIDEAQDNYHIKQDTLAIDACNDSVYAPTLKDMDFQSRAWDTNVANIDGAYDIGADESYL